MFKEAITLGLFQENNGRLHLVSLGRAAAIVGSSSIGRGATMSAKKLLFQIIGQIGLLLTAPKLWLWSRKLKRGPIRVWEGQITARIPMIDARTRCETQWAIKHKPSSYLPQPGSEEKKRTASAIPASPSAKKMGRQGLPLSVLPSQ